MTANLDHARLDEALMLAERSIGVSDPNPRVGCIIGRASGEVLGRGFTQPAGDAHAEVVALREAAAGGADVRGATAWVTLEPCAHVGRTPPCCDALIDAGISRVVVAMTDPFARVAGRGIERLRAAGVRVDRADSEHADRARELNIGFVSRHTRGRPWVRLKSAVSLDGRTALPDGRSQWITGAEARADGHAWRRRAGAIVTGIGTVLGDDPRLDVRLVPTLRQPLRVVVDSHWRTPPTARVLQPPGRALVCGQGAGSNDAKTRLATACEVLCLPVAVTMAADDGFFRLDIQSLFDELARREVNEVHVEAGPTLGGYLLREALVDELLVYIAPIIIGPGLPLAHIPAVPELSAAARWSPIEHTRIGDDLRIRLRPVSPAAIGKPAAVSQ